MLAVACGLQAALEDARVKLDWMTVGPKWVLIGLRKRGPGKLDDWEKRYAPGLLERGLIARSITVPGGYDLTSKGQQKIDERER